MTVSNDPFTGAQIQGVAYSKANMEDSNFDGAKLTASRFYALLEGASFVSSDMRACIFNDVNLSGSKIHDVNFSNTTFDCINMTNVEITNANLEGMTINNIPVSDLLDTYNKK